MFEAGLGVSGGDIGFWRGGSGCCNPGLVIRLMCGGGFFFFALLASGDLRSGFLLLGLPMVPLSVLE